MTTTSLSDTQLVILTAAAGRDDGAVLPIPNSLTLRGEARVKVLKSLLKRGLVEESAATAGAEHWREADDGQRLALTITAAGLESIGVDLQEAVIVDVPKSPKRRREAGKPETPFGRVPAPRSGTKNALVLDLLCRKTGATVPEIMAATGWQAHSVRGFLSGHVRKKLGHDVLSDKGEDGVRRYRIAA
jgi:hypothetical protein